MKILAVHPGPLMYSKVFLRLEPLGLELVAAAARRAGHVVQLIDLQTETHHDYFQLLRRWRPHMIAFSCNYLANLPEIIDLSKRGKDILPGCFIVVGGHSASFTADAILRHGAGRIDCVLKGEGEAGITKLLAALLAGKPLDRVPGAVSAVGEGPLPSFVENLDALEPAHDLVRHRRRYFLGTLDPCASIEFSRGCPWDCSFCSAWTFYGRSYRLRQPATIVAELAKIRESGIFIVDDVAFIHERHGFAIGEAIAKAGIRKHYYLETRGDVLLRNRDVFKFWKTLGLKYMFLGLEALDEGGLRKYRKRVPLGRNFEALEFARSLGVDVAINLIADPDWDHERFATVRQWCVEVPEVVNISINTPYPGTETWFTESRRLRTRDYRLFDIQHCVLPTKLPLEDFYRELVETQQVLNRKHLGWGALAGALRLSAGLLLKGQTNFVKSLFSFNSIYRPELLLADHQRKVAYEIDLPPPPRTKVAGDVLYLHKTRGRADRAIDDTTECFVDATRATAAP